MATYRLRPLWLVCAPMLALALALLPAASAGDSGAKDGAQLPLALEKPFPEGKQDLQAIQDHVKRIVAKVTATVVNIKIGPSQGSGVVISEDGYVLTAGHVSGEPGKTCTCTFPDGKAVKAKSLGRNVGADSGLIKILQEGKYPFCEMGKSSDVKKDQWCIVMGHPGGWKEGRSPPVRLGRVVSRVSAKGAEYIRTDCTLVGGDSGGPLFDMHGKVIGINSQINESLTFNLHVPVDVFRAEWDKLVKSESIGGKGGKAAKTPPLPTARLGIRADPDFGDKGIKIAEVTEGSPAEKAGIKMDDIITAFNSKAVNSLEELRLELEKRKPGDEVTVEIRRGAQTLMLKAVLDKAA